MTGQEIKTEEARGSDVDAWALEGTKQGGFMFILFCRVLSFVGSDSKRRLHGRMCGDESVSVISPSRLSP